MIITLNRNIELKDIEIPDEVFNKAIIHFIKSEDYKALTIQPMYPKFNPFAKQSKLATATVVGEIVSFRKDTIAVIPRNYISKEILSILIDSGFKAHFRTEIEDFVQDHNDHKQALKCKIICCDMIED